MNQFAEHQLRSVSQNVKQGAKLNNIVIRDLRSYLLVAIDMIDAEENDQAKAILERLLRVYKVEGEK